MADGAAALALEAAAVGVTISSLRRLTRAAEIVMQYGEPMLLRRAGEPDVIALKGKPYRNSEVELIGSASQQTLKVKIGWYEIEASTWQSRAPRRGDKIDIESQSRTILDVVPLDDRGAIELYDLTVVG